MILFICLKKNKIFFICRFPWLDPANFCLDTTAPDKNKTINH